MNYQQTVYQWLLTNHGFHRADDVARGTRLSLGTAKGALRNLKLNGYAVLQRHTWGVADPSVREIDDKRGISSRSRENLRRAPNLRKVYDYMRGQERPLPNRIIADAVGFTVKQVSGVMRILILQHAVVREGSASKTSKWSLVDRSVPFEKIPTLSRAQFKNAQRKTVDSTNSTGHNRLVSGCGNSAPEKQAANERLFSRHRAAKFPICFESRDQYNSWRWAADRAGGVGLSGYCIDCTPEYQARMIAEGRCSYPATTFKLDEDGEVVGQRSLRDKRAA